MPCKFTSCCCWRIWKRRDDDEIDDNVKTNENTVAKEIVVSEKEDAVSKEEITAQEDDGDVVIEEDTIEREDDSNDTSSSSGNPRNKCALQPGHSLMDWIRLGASGKDLTGVGPKAGHLSVTKLELATHNKETDAWLAIRGKVYNITEYLPFHPGGPEELIKGAGIDATRLFDQVHPWVNYDQILQKCFIGRLVSIDPSVDTGTLLFGNQNASPRNTTNDKQSVKLPSPKPVETITKEQPITVSLNEAQRPPLMCPVSLFLSQSMSVPTPKKSPEKVKDIVEVMPSTSAMTEPEIQYLDNYPLLHKDSTSNSQSEESEEQLEETTYLPRFDWIQRIDWITVIFYTHAFCNPLIEVFPPTPEKMIVISLTFDDTVYKNEVTFFEDVNWPGTINAIYDTGKIEVVFRKTEGKIWDNYGVLRQHHKPASAVASGVKFNFILCEKVQVNHNIFLLRLERTDGCKVVVPVGKHVRVFGNVDGQEMSRSYTAVPQTVFKKVKTQDPATDSLCLMVKRYEDGNVSRFLTDSNYNDVIYATKPLGDFDLRRMERRDVFILLAAGTGITPMLSLLVFLLGRRIKRCQFAILLFFNKTEKDIPLRQQLEDLAQFDDRLKIDHILSEPDEHWKGLTGHVNKVMIENAIQEHIRDTGYRLRHFFAFVCGPNPFVTLALEELHRIGIIDEQIHAFQG